MSFFKKIAKEFEDLGIGKDKDEKKDESHGYGGHGDDGHHGSEGYRGDGYRGGHEGYGGSYSIRVSPQLH